MFVERTEAFYRRQDCLESRAVNVPNGKKQSADDRSDDESDRSEEEQSAERSDQNEKVRHCRIPADKDWPQEIVDGGDHSAAPHQQQRCRQILAVNI